MKIISYNILVYTYLLISDEADVGTVKTKGILDLEVWITPLSISHNTVWIVVFTMGTTIEAMTEFMSCQFPQVFIPFKAVGRNYT